MGGLFRAPKADPGQTAAQLQELTRQRDLVEQQRQTQAAETQTLDAQEAARNAALTGALRGRAALLGADEDGVEAAEARGNVVPLKRKLGQ